MKNALLSLNEKAVLQEALDDHADVLDMLLKAPGEHEDVIQVEDHEYL